VPDHMGMFLEPIFSALMLAGHTYCLHPDCFFSEALSCAGFSSGLHCAGS
jgi:hypothetical protein